MKLGVYSIYDSKGKAFSQPFFSVNQAVAQRSFAQLVNEKGNNVSRFPEDFSLHHIGEFDDETANLVASTPVNLGLASQFKSQE